MLEFDRNSSQDKCIKEDKKGNANAGHGLFNQSFKHTIHCSVKNSWLVPQD
jgi:hypothetical protein